MSQKWEEKKGEEQPTVFHQQIYNLKQFIKMNICLKESVLGFVNISWLQAFPTRLYADFYFQELHTCLISIKRWYPDRSVEQFVKELYAEEFPSRAPLLAKSTDADGVQFIAATEKGSSGQPTKKVNMDRWEKAAFRDRERQ